MEETSNRQGVVLPPDAMCLSCGATLADSKRRTCSACLRPYHPLDRSTYSTTLAERDSGYWLSAPSGTECVLTGLFLFYYLYSVSSPAVPNYGARLGALICSAPVWMTLVIVYLRRRSVCTAYMRSRYAEPKMLAFLRRDRLRWYLLPMACLLIGLASISDWPVRLRFALSRSALERAVVEAQAGRFGQPHRVGFYYLTFDPAMSSVGPKGIGRVYFETPSYCLPPDRIGFEYNPDDAAHLPSVSFRIAPKWFCRSD